MLPHRCPKCWGPLHVAPELAGATRPCPLCGALIQLPSVHKPLPIYSAPGRQSTDPWAIGSGAAALLFGVSLVVLAFACWVAMSSLPNRSTANAAAARSVPVELQCDSDGLRGQITNNSGIDLKRVAVVVHVFERGKPTPIIKGVYHLEPAGGIDQGQTVNCQVVWENDHGRAYAMARGALAAHVEVSSLVGADGEALYFDLP